MAEFKVGDLTAWRQKFDLTQKKLSQVSGVSTLTIGQIENGLISGSAKTLAKLVKAVEVIEGRTGNVKSEPATSLRVVPEAVVSVPASTPSGSASQILCLSNLDLELINRILKMKPKQKLKVLQWMLAE